MRTLGRYTLLQRIDLGITTENWFALGPGAKGVIEPVRVTCVLPMLRGEPWMAEQLERARLGQKLGAPWCQTHFVGLEAGEPVQVQALRPGVRLSEVLRDGGLPAPVAARYALELCGAMEQAQALSGAAIALDDRAITVGWDGTLRLAGFELERLPRLEENDADPVFRVALLLSRMLKGNEKLMTRMAFPPMRTLHPGAPPPHVGVANVPAELARIIEKNLGASREKTCADLRRALEPHAVARDQAYRDIGEKVRALFVIERSIEIAQLGMCQLDALEPLPNDHVAKVYGGRDDEGDWLVLGDWFQGQSHPRGRLIALQMRGDATAGAGERARLEEEAAQLVDSTAELRVPRAGMQVRLAWRWGYVELCELYDLESVDTLNLLLAHPSMRFIEELIIENGDEERIAMLLAQARPPPPTLKVLRLPRIRGVVDAVRKAWPSLSVVARTVPDEGRPTHRFFR